MSTASSIRSPHLFDSADNGEDFVIHTSDDQHLYVVKSFLIFASPFFANLLKDSSPEEKYQGISVWRAPETGVTMTALLRLCYPIHLELKDVLLPEADLLAGQKYLMEGPLNRLRSMLLNNDSGGPLDKEPLRVLAIARRLRWDDVVQCSARALLRTPVRSFPNIPELEFLSSREYHRLQQWCWACGDAAEKVVARENVDGTWKTEDIQRLRPLFFYRSSLMGWVVGGPLAAAREVLH
ncbi:hypothetical protein CYLTODRAFT_424954, partial [Cylindrobasidium torrendii FP15055 ss-10]